MKQWREEDLLLQNPADRKRKVVFNVSPGGMLQRNVDWRFR